MIEGAMGQLLQEIQALLWLPDEALNEVLEQMSAEEGFDVRDALIEKLKAASARKEMHHAA
jgi:hypothetical protein